MRVDVGKDIQAEVYTENRDRKTLYLKVYIPSLRMYINSCTVKPSPKYGGLWFQLPAFFIGRKWNKPIEFSGDSEFLDLIKDAAMRAADQYIQDKKLEEDFPGATRTGQDEVYDVPF